MKRIRIYSLLLLLVCGASWAFAQRAEYWLDVDPGRGRGTAITVAGENASAAISTAALSPGMHTLGIRTAVGNKWSLTYTHSFIILPNRGYSSLSGAEYWVDNDPGHGKATAVSASASTTQLSMPVSTAGLDPGIHTVGARLKQGNYWGLTYTHTFVILPSQGVTTLSGAEYWVDSDPGHGKATAVSVAANATQLSLPVNTASLNPGIHTVGARLKQGNSWGHTYTHTFVILPSQGVTTLSGAEYWVDSDPGHGKATAVSVAAGATQLSLPVNTTGLEPGIHTVGARLKQGNSWGLTYTHTFVILPTNNASTLSGAEYWVDNDPGHGKATSFSVAADATQLSLPVNTSALQIGEHIVGIRLRQGNSWGHTYTHSFVILPNTAFEMTVQAIEGYWDYDFDHPMSIPFTQVGDSVIISHYPLPTNTLANGKHTLYLRAKADGKWGFMAEHEFCKTPIPLFEVFGEGEALCQGAIVYFDDLSSNVDASTTYAWDINSDGVTDYTTVGGITHTYTQPGNYTVTLTLRTADGCEATYTQQITIHSNANPTVALSLNNGVCIGSEVTLTATATNAGAAPVYEWLVNNRKVAETSEPTFTYSAFANGDKVAVTLIADNPCALQPVVTSAETTMVIYPLPEPSLNVPAVIYTDAATMSLANYATPAGGKFYLDDATTATSFIRPNTVGTGGHTLRYVVTSEHGCTAETQTTFTVMERPKYTITFVDDDGTILQQSQVSLDAMPVPPADPTKAATAQYTYTFAGWNTPVVAATADATYTATYNAVVNKYTVTFLGDDGTTILASAEYDYGATPTPPADPTKAATAQYTYTFAGWNTPIMAVTGAATYTATYTASVNRYTITFLAEDGTTVLSTEEYEYGETPEAPVAPDKAATAQYTYTFSGWTPTIVSVVSEATYTATYSSVVNRYTVTFVDEDGTTILASAEYDYGATPTPPADPTKAATAQYTYTFAGWNTPVVAVTGDVTYTATYNTVVNKYTVTFVDEDGTTILASAEYDYGATPVVPADPTKAATAQYTYTFAGWNTPIVAVTGAATYTATYTASVNRYTITFLAEDGTTVLASEEYEYGELPEAPVAPDKPADVQYTYTFAGWTPAVASVTGEVTYTATYSGILNRYTVTFVDEDGTTVLASSEYDYGTTPTPPSDPTKPADDEYTYTFSGWTPALADVTGDAVYTATYEATVIPQYECHEVNSTWLQTGGTGFGEITTDDATIWRYDATYGAKGSKQGGHTGYLLTPAKDLRGSASVTLSFSHTHKYAGTPSEELTLWVTPDYKGSVAASAWQQLTIPTYGANTNWTFVNVTIDVPLAMVGENTVFGFKYMSTATAYATWEVKNLTLVSECANIGTSWESPTAAPQPQKVMEDDLLYIVLPDGSKYSATGAKVQ